MSASPKKPSPAKEGKKNSPKKAAGVTSPKKEETAATAQPAASIFSQPPTTFGTPSLFGTGSGATGNIFGSAGTDFSFAPATFGASVKAGGDDDDDGDDGVDTGANHDADESHAAQFKPLVQLKEVKVTTMEEDEEVVLKLRAKLFVFIKEDIYGGETRKNYWKERGLGDVKVLKHKEHGMTRLLMRQEKTLKICMNHLISPGVVFAPNVGSDRSWVFTAQDFADETLKTETFAIKFNNEENAKAFKDAVEEAKKTNAEKMKEQKLDTELASSTSGLAIDASADKKPALVGGYSEKSVEDEEVQKVGKFVAQNIGMGDFVKVAAAQAQVVAGMNYKLTVHIKYSVDGNVHAHNVLVHVPLPHTNQPMQLKENSHVGVI